MSDIAASEQDLAKVLSDTSGIADMPSGISSDTQTTSGLNFEETSTPAVELPPIVPPDLPAAPITGEPVIQPLSSSDSTFPAPTPPPVVDEPVVQPLSANPVISDELTTIKKDALSELRPLVDKLNVSAEERFDTYLLLIRSTDDVSLLAPAHEAAKAIVDETRRAEALLDIIKEVDFLSQNNKAA